MELISGSIKGGVLYRQAWITPPQPGAVICVATFLPVRRWRDVLAFLGMSSRAERQLLRTTGLVRYGLRADILHKRFWTLSVWTDLEAMNAFVNTEPHRTAVARFSAWAGESAAFIQWRSGDASFDWAESPGALKESDLLLRSYAVSSRRMHMAMMQNDGLVHLRSRYSVPETLQRLESVLQAHGLTIFCRVDHSGEAEKVGLKMPPTQLLIFGNPTAGTPLMVASPTLAIDLPMKALAWQDADGTVWLTHNSPEYLKWRHHVPDELLKNIAGAGAILRQAAD